MRLIDFEIFPDYPNIKWGSKTSKIDLARVYSSFSWEQIEEKLQELHALGFIEPCKNDEYVITLKGLGLLKEKDYE